MPRSFARSFSFSFSLVPCDVKITITVVFIFDDFARMMSDDVAEVLDAPNEEGFFAIAKLEVG